MINTSIVDPQAQEVNEVIPISAENSKSSDTMIQFRVPGYVPPPNAWLKIPPPLVGSFRKVYVVDEEFSSFSARTNKTAAHTAHTWYFVLNGRDVCYRKSEL